MYRAGLASTIVVLAACGSGTPATAPLALDDAAPFTPPAWYASAYASMQHCSGLTGDFANVHWYHVAGSRVAAPEHNGYAAAVTYPAQHTIIVADFYAADTVVIEHEVMHELADVTSHPPQWFDGRCGDLMP